MKDVFNNGEYFSYLKKEFDSKEEGFSHKLKIFEINYEKFDEFYENRFIETKFQ